MHQVLYINTEPTLSDGYVATILSQSQRNNAQHEIIGFLLYNGRNFMQLLEGSDAHLTTLLRKLSYDTRHTGIIRLAHRGIRRANMCGLDYGAFATLRTPKNHGGRIWKTSFRLRSTLIFGVW